MIQSVPRPPLEMNLELLALGVAIAAGLIGLGGLYLVRRFTRKRHRGAR